jgi:hypothetical protein
VAAEHPELLRVMNIEGTQASERLDYISERFIQPQMDRFQQIWDELAQRGEVKEVPLEVIYFMITSGGGAMFASKALTERLFTSEPLEPGHYSEYAEQFTDLLMNAVKES